MIEISIPKDEEIGTEYPFPARNLLVVKLDSGRKSEGGILLPEAGPDARADRARATVIFSGPDCVRPYSNPGRRVIISTFDMISTPARFAVGKADVALYTINEDAVFNELRNDAETIEALRKAFADESEGLKVNEIVVRGEKVAIPVIEQFERTWDNLAVKTLDDGTFEVTATIGFLSATEIVGADTTPSNPTAVPGKVRDLFAKLAAGLVKQL